MAERKWIPATDFMDDLFSDVDENDSEYIYYDTLGRIAIEIVNYRVKHGLSQTALAKTLGVTQAMVSKYESGDYNISLKAAIDLLTKLGISFNFSIGEDKNRDEMPYSDGEYTSSESTDLLLTLDEYESYAGAA